MESEGDVRTATFELSMKSIALQNTTTMISYTWVHNETSGQFVNSLRIFIFVLLVLKQWSTYYTRKEIDNTNLYNIFTKFG